MSAISRLLWWRHRPQRVRGRAESGRACAASEFGTGPEGLMRCRVLFRDQGNRWCRPAPRQEDAGHLSTNVRVADGLALGSKAETPLAICRKGWASHQQSLQRITGDGDSGRWKPSRPTKTEGTTNGSRQRLPQVRRSKSRHAKPRIHRGFVQHARENSNPQPS